MQKFITSVDEIAPFVQMMAKRPPMPAPRQLNFKKECERLLIETFVKYDSASDVQPIVMGSPFDYVALLIANGENLSENRGMLFKLRNVGRWVTYDSQIHIIDNTQNEDVINEFLRYESSSMVDLYGSYPDYCNFTNRFIGAMRTLVHSNCDASHLVIHMPKSNKELEEIINNIFE